MKNDIFNHKTISIIKKYNEELKSGELLKDFELRCSPYFEEEFEGNSMVEAGVDILWTLACGAAATNYGSSNAAIHIYIVDTWDTTGALADDFPTYGSDGKAVWKSAWTGTNGDGVWSKWAVSNGAQRLNEKTQTMGTKDGGTWTLQVSITIT